MIDVTVTTVPHLLADDQMVQLGKFIQEVVAEVLDVPDDEDARVRREDVSVEFRSFVYGINLRAIRVLILAPDHPRRRADFAERLERIGAAIRECPDMPTRSITNQKGGVLVKIMLGPSVAMHL
ncbi:hypothetical protein FJY94_03715 [Candidatus Kaiserbacteria bacterium]|nr:hypothetical protein [Candidatus Kaiserbacteria bacterium]